MTAPARRSASRRSAPAPTRSAARSAARAVRRNAAQRGSRRAGATAPPDQAVLEPLDRAIFLVPLGWPAGAPIGSVFSQDARACAAGSRISVHLRHADLHERCRRQAQLDRHRRDHPPARPAPWRSMSSSARDLARACSASSAPASATRASARRRRSARIVTRWRVGIWAKRARRGLCAHRRQRAGPRIAREEPDRLAGHLPAWRITSMPSSRPQIATGASAAPAAGGTSRSSICFVARRRGEGARSDAIPASPRAPAPPRRLPSLPISSPSRQRGLSVGVLRRRPPCGDS